MNRDTKAIIIIISVGILLVGGLFGYEHIQAEVITEIKPSNQEKSEGDLQDSINIELEMKIDSLKMAPLDQEDFTILMIEIHSNFMVDAYTGSIKTSLENRLIDTFSELIFKKTESFLIRGSSNSQQILAWLDFAEQNGATPSKVNYYKRQINWHNYYAYTLPAKVNNFISAGITNYSEEEYKDFKKEISEMPNLEKRFQTSRFSNLRGELLHNLGEFNGAFYSPNYEPEYINL